MPTALQESVFSFAILFVFFTGGFAHGDNMEHCRWQNPHSYIFKMDDLSAKKLPVRGV